MIIGVIRKPTIFSKLKCPSRTLLGGEPARRRDTERAVTIATIRNTTAEALMAIRHGTLIATLVGPRAK
jgi:hypothetical protein